jgi:hypothetical protein
LTFGAILAAGGVWPALVLRPAALRRAGNALEIHASADLAAGLVSPDWPTRLRAAGQWQEDQRLRQHLRELEPQYEQMAIAMRRNFSSVTRFWADATAQQTREKFPEHYASVDERPLTDDELGYARYRTEVWRGSTFPDDLYPRATLPVTLVPFIVIPGAWIVWAFLTRGGINYWLHNLTLVRGDGGRAGRFRCAWRAFVVWVPIATLLWSSLALDYWYWAYLWDPTKPYPIIPWLSWLTWWAAAAMLVFGVAVALRSPQHGLHDWLAGTYLVPR